MRLQTFILFFLLFITTPGFTQNNQLDYFLKEAIVNSPLLKDNQNQILLNDIDSIRILADYKPHLNFTSNNMYAPVVNGYGYDKAITNGGNLIEQLAVSKTFVNKKNIETE